MCIFHRMTDLSSIAFCAFFIGFISFQSGIPSMEQSSVGSWFFFVLLLLLLIYVLFCFGLGFFFSWKGDGGGGGGGVSSKLKSVFYVKMNVYRHCVYSVYTLEVSCVVYHCLCSLVVRCLSREWEIPGLNLTFLSCQTPCVTGSVLELVSPVSVLRDLR